jgi:23S rRNA (guanosine2251-2'-O)-methyltransferase
MPGNSQRRGAIRKSSKRPTAGSGGRVRRGLEGKGPTPKAADRPNHKAHKLKAKAEREASRRPRKRPTDGDEWIAGRNAVVEALRAGVPVSGLYVAEGSERDGRLREAFKIAAERGISLLEVTRPELDRRTDGAVHQGLAARIPATSTPTRRTCSTPRPNATRYRWSWPSTRSPTRATSARW